MKECKVCKQEKPETEEYFVFRNDTHKFRNTCRACQNKRKMERYHSNDNGIKDKYQEYRDRNRDKIKSHYHKNRETISERHKKWYHNNRERELAKLKARQEEKREFYRKINRESYHRNKDKGYNITRTKNYLNSLRNPELESNFSYDDWVSCLEYFDYECAYCGATNKKLERDHVIPVAKGGNFTLDNVVCVCRSCNSHKSKSDFLIWYAKQQFYSLDRQNKVLRYLNTSIRKSA